MLATIHEESVGSLTCWLENPVTSTRLQSLSECCERLPKSFSLFRHPSTLGDELFDLVIGHAVDHVRLQNGGEVAYQTVSQWRV